ncbi:MAG: Crp/Fnr family transcriptional regulator [Acidobacteriota bacterium]
MHFTSSFCDITGDALAAFEKLGMKMRLPKGAILFMEDDPCDAATMLCSGQVKLSCTSRGGKTLILKIAVPGEMLGLGAVISGANFEVTAEAVEPCMVKKIRREELMNFLEQYGQASLRAARSLSNDYQCAFFDARRLALSRTAAGRLAGILLGLGRAVHTGHPEMRFTMALTHEELASLAGTSRETVTRAMGKFQREGLIAVHGSSVHVLAPDKLEGLSL